MTRDITETPCILIDTNIWLDMYIPNREGADDAVRLIDIAQEQSASLVFASHTCLDVFQKVSSSRKLGATAPNPRPVARSRRHAPAARDVLPSVADRG